VRHPIIPFAILALLSLTAAADPAAADPAAADPPERTTSLVVYGSDPCPKSQGDEIVVCARRPENERYRIPKALRRNRNELSENSWSSRFGEMEEATRYTRPNSCSVVGTGGQTGCLAAMLRQWFAERRFMQTEAASVP
jgi:hypothetical protein